MKIKIKVTKDVLRKAMWCKPDFNVYSNCAISLAVRDIFPNAETHSTQIWPIGHDFLNSIELPKEAQVFISRFDQLHENPERRLHLPQIEFEIDVPEHIINQINISDIHKSETLEVVG